MLVICVLFDRLIASIGFAVQVHDMNFIPALTYGQRWILSLAKWDVCYVI